MIHNQVLNEPFPTPGSRLDAALARTCCAERLLRGDPCSVDVNLLRLFAEDTLRPLLPRRGARMQTKIKRNFKLAAVCGFFILAGMPSQSAFGQRWNLDHRTVDARSELRATRRLRRRKVLRDLRLRDQPSWNLRSGQQQLDDWRAVTSVLSRQRIQSAHILWLRCRRHKDLRHWRRYWWQRRTRHQLCIQYLDRYLDHQQRCCRAARDGSSAAVNLNGRSMSLEASTLTGSFRVAWTFTTRPLIPGTVQRRFPPPAAEW